MPMEAFKKRWGWRVYLENLRSSDELSWVHLKDRRLKNMKRKQLLKISVGKKNEENNATEK